MEAIDLKVQIHTGTNIEVSTSPGTIELSSRLPVISTSFVLKMPADNIQYVVKAIVVLRNKVEIVSSFKFYPRECLDPTVTGLTSVVLRSGDIIVFKDEIMLGMKIMVNYKMADFVMSVKEMFDAKSKIEEYTGKIANLTVSSIYHMSQHQKSKQKIEKIGEKIKAQNQFICSRLQEYGQ